ncbi:hypothetical protein [Brevibacillus sp. H7]|uniref:hypothetical protein n=1 Tax=Brevibacillus sp. H7 TaxID=3349138 RepID=UPI003805D0A7
MFWIWFGTVAAIVLFGAWLADRKRRKKRYPEECRQETIRNAQHTDEKLAESMTRMDRP